MDKNEFQIDLTQSVNVTPWPLRIRRGIWKFVFQPLTIWLPRRLTPLRVFVWKVMGAKIGHGILIGAGTDLLMPWNLKLGDFVAIGEGARIYNHDLVEIGSMTVVSQRAFLCCGTHDHTSPTFPLVAFPIRLGDQVWVAAEALIGPGVTVGNGAVVGARAAVFKNVEPWTIVGGNPAKFIKKRELREPALTNTA